MTEKDELLTYKQVAELLGVPKGTAYSLVHRHQIPHFRIGGRLVRFSRAEVIKWLNSCHVDAQNLTTEKGAE